MNQDIQDKLTEHFSKSIERKYPKGTTIILAGQDPLGVSLLVDGIVEQYDITPEGNKVIVNIFKPLAFFPMSWAINKTPNEYFYAALTDIKLRQADPDKTLDFLKANPDVMFNLLSRVYKGTDALLRRLVIAARGVAANRLVFELLIEAYRFGTPGDDETVLINIKQNALAARSGLARETISRELHKLQNDGSVSLSKQGIKINIKQLEEKLDISV